MFSWHKECEGTIRLGTQVPHLENTLLEPPSWLASKNVLDGTWRAQEASEHVQKLQAH